MTTIEQFVKETRENNDKITFFDVEIILAHVLKKSKEFIMAHPEYSLTSHQTSVINKFIKRRLRGEPIAYILKRKEFYGLEFIVNKHTLIPRPETEQLVELALTESNVKRQTSNIIFVDVGTGSGNIISSIAKAIEKSKFQNPNVKFFGIDISKNALEVAKKNAKIHGVDKKIKFLHGSLLTPLKKTTKPSIIGNQSSLIITANLPYLSRGIYNSAPVDVKNFEPKTALYSSKHGLAHYEKLLQQIRLLITGYRLPVTCILEISPEQKKLLPSLIKSIFPKAKISFQKDLAGKWRICKIQL